VGNRIRQAMLCNWMVTMGVVMSMVSSSTVSKIVAAWAADHIFFGLGYEHTVVNMFLIPRHLARCQDDDWRLVVLEPDPRHTRQSGRGFSFFTGLALYWTYRVRANPIRSGETAAQTSS